MKNRNLPAESLAVCVPNSRVVMNSTGSQKFHGVSIADEGSLTWQRERVLTKVLCDFKRGFTIFVSESFGENLSTG